MGCAVIDKDKTHLYITILIPQETVDTQSQWSGGGSNRFDEGVIQKKTEVLFSLQDSMPPSNGIAFCLKSQFDCLEILILNIAAVARRSF